MFILSHTLSKALFLGYMKGLQGLKRKLDHILTDSTPVNIIIEPLSICHTDALT